MGYIDILRRGTIPPLAIKQRGFRYPCARRGFMNQNEEQPNKNDVLTREEFDKMFEERMRKREDPQKDGSSIDDFEASLAKREKNRQNPEQLWNDLRKKSLSLGEGFKPNHKFLQGYICPHCSADLQRTVVGLYTYGDITSMGDKCEKELDKAIYTCSCGYKSAYLSPDYFLNWDNY